jgi:hypothetical protein
MILFLMQKQFSSTKTNKKLYYSFKCFASFK